MPNLDIRSDLEPVLILNHAWVTIDTIEPSEIIDTANFDGGIMFFATTAFIADGTYTFAVWESDLLTMIGEETEVPAEKIIDDISKLTITTSTVLNIPIPAIGIFSTKRYVRLKVTSSGVSSGATILAYAIKKTEYMPITNQ